MNASYYEGLVNRNIDYILKGKTEANFSGENYDDSYIGIQINFDLDWQYDDRDIIKFVLMDPERGLVLSENLIIYNINLLKFREKYYNNVELSEFERAITLLTLTKREDIEKISEGVEGLMEAKEEIKKLSDNLGIIGVYDYEKNKENHSPCTCGYDGRVAGSLRRFRKFFREGRGIWSFGRGDSSEFFLL